MWNCVKIILILGIIINEAFSESSLEDQLTAFDDKCMVSKSVQFNFITINYRF